MLTKVSSFVTRPLRIIVLPGLNRLSSPHYLSLPIIYEWNHLGQMKRLTPPVDHSLTRRRFILGSLFNAAFPKLAHYLSSKVLDKMFLRTWPEYDPSWKFIPAPPLANAPGGMNDHLISLMKDGQITNLSGIVRFTKTSVVTMDHGDIECDAVILCTGMKFDYSILSPEADPSSYPTPEWDSHPHSQGLAYPRLYRTLFHTNHPESLAFIGPYRGVTFAGFSSSDLASQAIAQVWADRFPLPDKAAITKWCDENYAFSLAQIAPHRVPRVGCDPISFEKWLNEAAGNGVNEHLGWGWTGWAFWWKDRKFHGILMDGVNTPFMYRFWEGRKGSRKVFENAREEIYKANGIASGSLKRGVS